MSYKATNWAYETKISGPPKPVLVALAEFADEDATCWPGQEKLAAMTGFSVATVRRALDRLEQLGLLTREHRHGNFGYRTSDRYRLQLSVTVTETLPLTEPRRHRALKALSPSLPITVHIPSAHSERTVEPSVKPSVEPSGGEPSLFCSKHPSGNGGRCGGCGDARRIHDKWKRDQVDVVAPTQSGIVTPPACRDHGYPAGTCPTCDVAVAS